MPEQQKFKVGDLVRLVVPDIFCESTPGWIFADEDSEDLCLFSEVKYFDIGSLGLVLKNCEYAGLHYVYAQVAEDNYMFLSDHVEKVS